MSGDTKVSVAMATYNGARYLPAQLESIAAQTRLPDELVVGDDGSTDSTPEIVAAFARRVPFEVRFTRNASRLGSTQNFTACLERCRGDVVLLTDQDDVWLPTRVHRTVDVLERHPEAAYAFSDALVMDADGRETGGRLWQSAFFGAEGRRAFFAHRGTDVLLRTNVVTGATMGIVRGKLAAALPIPQGWVHDAWIAFVLELRFGAIPIEEPLIRYRRHASQQIGVVRLTPRAILEVIRRQDSAFYLREARNYRQLAERVAALDGPSSQAIAERIRRKSRFLEGRAAFRATPGRAAGSFVRSVIEGEYRQFGLGAKQAMFDLCGAIASRVPLRSSGDGRR